MKKDLRKELLAKRSQLSREDVAFKSSSISKQLISNPIYEKANHVMVYLSFRNEVETASIIKDLFDNNKKVYIPLTVPDTREMIVSELLDLEKDLEIGNFGVLEPKKDAVRPVPIDTLDLVLVPGVGFDKRGYRVGYGGGYYDRFLPKLSQAVPTVALAFDVQMIEKAPTDQYDFPVQYVITEEEFIDCRLNKY